MSEVDRALRTIAAHLRRRKVPFALVDGLAVAVRGEPRLTRDADLAVAVASDTEAEALIHELMGEGYRVTAAIEHKLNGRLATIRLTGSTDERSVVTDLLFASCGIEHEIVAMSEVVEVVSRLKIPVAQRGHLAGARLVVERGYHRDRDVVGAVEQLRRSPGEVRGD